MDLTGLTQTLAQPVVQHKAAPEQSRSVSHWSLTSTGHSQGSSNLVEHLPPLAPAVLLRSSLTVSLMVVLVASLVDGDTVKVVDVGILVVVLLVTVEDGVLLATTGMLVVVLGMLVAVVGMLVLVLGMLVVVLDEGMLEAVGVEEEGILLVVVVVDGRLVVEEVGMLAAVVVVVEDEGLVVVVLVVPWAPLPPNTTTTITTQLSSFLPIFLVHHSLVSWVA